MSVQDRLKRTLILCLIGLAIGAVIAGIQISSHKGDKKAEPLIVANIGGEWRLNDHNGKTRTPADFKGKYQLVYFGFTYCPAICPTELQKISRALHKLDKITAAKIQPLFITIDPERDTVKIMKNYVELFDMGLIGLTGSVEDIEAAKSSFKVYGAKVPGSGKDDYTMDHSSYIYLMDTDNKLLAMFKTQDDAQKIADTLKSVIN